MANKKRIVIVDDDPDMRKTVKQLLESSGYKVYSYENGLDCIKNLRQGKYKPTLIILDIMMPLMSGWEIQRRLSENAQWKDIPIIFLTSRTNDTADDMYARYGADFVKKPFDINDLKARIEETINGKKQTCNRFGS